MIETVLSLFAAPCGKNFFGLPVWYKHLSEAKPGGGCTEIAFTSIYDLFKILAAVVEIALRLGVLLAVGFIIFAGIQWIVSQGDPQGITKARDTLVNAIIGLIITMLATIVVSIVTGRFL